MVDTSFTRGPWMVPSATQSGSPYYVYSDDATGSAVACVKFNYVVRSDEELRANAHLIAAAPDLLAELIDTLAFVNEAISWLTDSELGPLIERRERLEALIAKATGEPA